MSEFNTPPVSRRKILAWLGAGGAAILAQRGAAAVHAVVPAAAADAAMHGAPDVGSCVLTPEITVGPFFVDGQANRSDLTTGTNDPSVTAAVPLTVTLNLYSTHGSACVPRSGVYVDMWHADAAGKYSDEDEIGTGGTTYLRGYQISDDAGQVSFQTIFPGWYRGRTAHIHMLFRTFAGSTATLEYTTQLFFDEATTAAVFAKAPYAGRGERDTTNANDDLYDRTTQVKLVKSGTGYATTFAIGLQTA